MSRKEEINRVLFNLYNLGFDADEAGKLRGIAMTLSRWCEHEANGDIERDEQTGKTYRVFNLNSHHSTVRRYPTADREMGALKRLEKIMGKHPELGYYYQTDPRGASLYIYRKISLACMGATIDCCYSSIGIAVY